MLRPVALDLAENELRLEGAAELARGLKGHGALARLDVASNYLQAAGCAAIFEALRASTTLTWLSVARNDLTDEGADAATGAEALAALLTGCPSLATLNLSETHLAGVDEFESGAQRRAERIDRGRGERAALDFCVS